MNKSQLTGIAGIVLSSIAGGCTLSTQVLDPPQGVDVEVTSIQKEGENRVYTVRATIVDNRIRNPNFDYSIDEVDIVLNGDTIQSFRPHKNTIIQGTFPDSRSISGENVLSAIGKEYCNGGCNLEDTHSATYRK